ncbi:hypothetical protein A203_19730 [Chromobacterium violaceum]
MLLNASASSPLWKLPVMDTVADASVVLSRSDRVMPPSTATGVDAVLLPAVKAALPPLAVAIGVWSVAATVTVLVVAALFLLPSLTTKLTVRVAVLGVTALSVYLTARSAACHCASVAVAPLELSVNTPVPLL